MPQGVQMTENLLGVSLRNERRPNMSADILKRKLRNFPAANLSLRIAAAS
jgi:hypothetical protein